MIIQSGQFVMGTPFRAVMILPTELLEKYDGKRKEQNARKIGKTLEKLFLKDTFGHLHITQC